MVRVNEVRGVHEASEKGVTAHGNLPTQHKSDDSPTRTGNN